MSTATFSLTQVRKLYDALGVPTAAEWDAPTAAGKLKTIGKLSDAVGDVSDPTLTALYDQVAAAVTNGDEIVVTDDVKEVKKAKGGKAKAAKNAKPAKAPKGDGKGKDKRFRNPAHQARPGETEYQRRCRVWEMTYGKEGSQPISDRGPGVTKAVVRELKAHGKGAKPVGITKQELLRILKDEFRDRDPVKMLVTISNLIPSRLRDERGLHVWRVARENGEIAYHLRPDNKPQPADEAAHAKTGPKAAGGKKAPAKTGPKAAGGKKAPAKGKKEKVKA